MLVLSRKKNESIVINNDVVVTVVEIREDKVRLGIVAPKDVPIHRQEVYDAIFGRSDDGPSLPSPPPVETGDILPDLIVECRLAPASQGPARFTAEGGYYFPDRRRSGEG
ncbi:MAG TPA: carbon storage regulator CsrA [Gemmataceae bacterium]